MQRSIAPLLISCCCHRQLDALARGIADIMGIAFRSVASIEEVISLTDLSLSTILVIGLCKVEDDALAVIDKASSAGALTICVIDTLPNNRVMAIFRAGAISCMTLETAMDSLIYVVESACRNLDKARTAHSEAQESVRLGEDLVLHVPSYIVSDGDYKTRLTAIPGRLLECLAAHPKETLPFRTLIGYAWEDSANVSREAVHQQIYVLREILDIYGSRGSIQCRRGIGYSFEPMS